ncbi:MAG: hypothetical protein ACI854_002639, partial [Arenicella sp.]
MKTITKIFIASSLVLISLQSDAKSPSFTYVGAEYVASGEIRVADDSLSIDIDTDGFALSASAELGIFLVQLSQLTLESDEFLGASIEDSITTLGVGITFKLPQTQLYALVRGRYDNLKLKGGELF